MRILILNWRDSSHPEGGGSEDYVEQLGQGLIKTGHEVTLHCARYAGATATARQGQLDIRRKGGRLSVYPHGLAAVLRMKPDVVVDVQNHLPFFSRLVHKRVITVVHHLGREQWLATYGKVAGRVGWWIESWLAPRVQRGSRYVAVSTPTRNDLIALGIKPDGITVAYNASDPPPHRPKPLPKAPHPLIVVVGRMMPHKQIAHAVDIAARLADEFPGLRLQIIGDGPLREEIARHVTSLGADSFVDMMGHLNDQSKLDTVAKAWLLICPSLKEGWGRVVMEAAAEGVPAVAYRHAGGLSESIVHGQTGLLADSLEEMTEHVRSLLKDDAAREAMGLEAKAYASTFTVERLVAEFDSLLRRL